MSAMRRRGMTIGMRLVACTLAFLLVPASAWAATPRPRLGEPHGISAFTTSARIVESASDGTHRALVAAVGTPAGGVRNVVLFRTAAGRWTRFELPPPADPVQRIRLALLENGDGLAAWDDGDRVAAQRWHPDGRVDRPYTALAAVRTSTGGASDDPNWDLGSDGSGTVAVVAPRPAARGRLTVQVAVRESAGEFGPPQQVAVLGGDARVLPPVVEPGGAITVRWRGGAARRPAAGAPFAAPVADTWELSPGFQTTGPDAVVVTALSSEILRALPRGTRTVTLAGTDATGGPVKIGPALRGLCRMGATGCTEAHRFVWPGGTQRLAILVSEPAPAQAAQWWVAEEGRDGSFVRPRLVSVNAALAPLWGGTPGRVDFAGVDTDGAPGVPLPGARLYVVPYGVGPAVADRRAPRIRFGDRGIAADGAALLPVWCTETCALRVRARVERPGRRAGSWRPAAALDAGGSYAVRIEPFQAVAIRVRLASPFPGTRLQVRVTARDQAGRITTSRTAYRAAGAPEAGAWCRAGAC